MIRHGLVVGVSVVMLLTAGCAKRPAATMSSAPPPTGGATAAAAPAPGGAGTMRAAPASQPTGQPGRLTSAAPAARPIPGEYASTPELEDVHFDFDKYDIRPGDAKILDADATWLKNNADRLVLIEGHCDERGTNEYNIALGERRARATLNYLVARGVAATRITIVSYGEERPLCSEHTESCWAQNRRAHFLAKRG
jgi:peptidoglycan-associated lipoprotein